LTEDHVVHGDPFGYRFTETVETNHGKGAKAIGQAILENWRTHPRDEDAGDDVTLAVVKLP